MDLFEFILIITSVIYAMAVAQVLSGIGRLAQSDARITWFLPHSIWTLTLFVFIFLVWWSVWEFRDIDWTFPMYLYMVVAPTLTYFASYLLIPRSVGQGDIDLAAHFFRIRLPFLWSFLLAAVAGVLDGKVLIGEPWWFPGRGGHVALVAIVLAGIVSRNRRVQMLVAILVMLALAYVMVTRLWNPR